METTVSYVTSDDGKSAWMSTDEQRWIKRLKKWEEEYPGEVTVRARPEENDGCWYGKIPRAWVKVAPPRQMSEEQRAAAAARLAAVGRKKKAGDGG